MSLSLRASAVITAIVLLGCWVSYPSVANEATNSEANAPPLPSVSESASSFHVTSDDLEGVAAYNRADFASALAKLLPSSDSGDPVAQYFVGLMYLRGEGVPKNPTLGVELLDKSATFGVADAENYMGTFYRKGDYVPLDYDRAMRWYLLAAKQNYKNAQHRIALMYRDGLGVQQDNRMAYMWACIASTAGPPEAIALRDSLQKQLSDEEAIQAQQDAAAWRANSITTTPVSINSLTNQGVGSTSTGGSTGVETPTGAAPSSTAGNEQAGNVATSNAPAPTGNAAASPNHGVVPPPYSAAPAIVPASGQSATQSNETGLSSALGWLKAALSFFGLAIVFALALAVLVAIVSVIHWIIASIRGVSSGSAKITSTVVPASNDTRQPVGENAIKDASPAHVELDGNAPRAESPIAASEPAPAAVNVAKDEEIAAERREADTPTPPIFSPILSSAAKDYASKASSFVNIVSERVAATQVARQHGVDSRKARIFLLITATVFLAMFLFLPADEVFLVAVCIVIAGAVFVRIRHRPATPTFLDNLIVGALVVFGTLFGFALWGLSVWYFPAITLIGTIVALGVLLLSTIGDVVTTVSDPDLLKNVGANWRRWRDKFDEGWNETERRQPDPDDRSHRSHVHEWGSWHSDAKSQFIERRECRSCGQTQARNI